MSNDYKKKVAVILPKWCLDQLVDLLDSQYCSILQDIEWYLTNTHEVDEDGVKEMEDERDRISEALEMIIGQT